MRWANWFEDIAGLLIGRSAATDSTNEAELSYKDALISTIGDLSCPVLWDVDIGHQPPQLLLINGAVATVRYAETIGGEIVQRFI